MSCLSLCLCLCRCLSIMWARARAYSAMNIVNTVPPGLIVT